MGSLPSGRSRSFGRNEVRTNGEKLCKHLITEVTARNRFSVMQKKAAQTSGGPKRTCASDFAVLLRHVKVVCHVKNERPVPSVQVQHVMTQAQRREHHIPSVVDSRIIRACGKIVKPRRVHCSKQIIGGDRENECG